MNTMEPVRDPKKIRELIKYILDNGYKRDSILVLFSLNTLLRVSDMIDIKYEQLFDENRNIREYFDVTEKKSISKAQNPTRKLKKKVRRIKLPADFARELKKYADDLEMRKGDYFFYSSEDPNSHIHRKTVWRRMSRYGAAVGIDNLGCHGLRKSGAFLMWKKGVAIRVVSELLGHTNIAQTFRYIGVNQQMIDEAMERVNFSFARILKDY